MPNALAVLVGLRKVNPARYRGWDGTGGCWGCELDVDNVERILQPLGYQRTILKTENATKRKLMDALASATRLKSGDIFVFYYSGHGGQQPDQTGDGKDELDGNDETLVLYDGELRDDSLNEIWTSMKPGVRVVMLSDSCNSGTNYKDLGATLSRPTPIVPLDAKAATSMRAQLIHLGGCRDSKTSAGYASGGLFTVALCNTWGGGFKKPYKALYDAVSAAVTGEQPGQQPSYNEYGPVTAQFRTQRPFTI
jgi:metacaspase-1